MTDTSAGSDLARLTSAEFAGYFEHLAQRVEEAVRSVPEESLWTKPFPFGNSIGHLVLHLTGNLNHYIGATIAGTAISATVPGSSPIRSILLPQIS